MTENNDFNNTENDSTNSRNEKRFKLSEPHGAYLVDDENYIVGHWDNDDDKIIDLLNSLNEENEQLKHNNKMLSMKMSEVYTKYRLLKEFSEDTNPNDAVKKVLSEIMQITKEYR